MITGLLFVVGVALLLGSAARVLSGGPFDGGEARRIIAVGVVGVSMMGASFSLYMIGM